MDENKKYWGKKFYQSGLNTALLIILIVLMMIALNFMFKNKSTYVDPILGDKTEDKVNEYTLDKSQMLGKTEDLISFSIASGTKVPKGILSYRGEIKGGWFFEANIQINILDANKNVLKASNAVAKTDWMTAEGVEFEGNIDFTGLPAGPAYFEIHNDNASGLPEHDKFIQIPIVIQ